MTTELPLSPSFQFNHDPPSSMHNPTFNFSEQIFDAWEQNTKRHFIYLVTTNLSKESISIGFDMLLSTGREFLGYEKFSCPRNI